LIRAPADHVAHSRGHGNAHVEIAMRIDTHNRAFSVLGAALLAAGLLGHVLAAQAIGGTTLAYRDHLVGFVGLTVVSGALIVALGRRFWRSRNDVSLLIVGALQALLGLIVYIERFSVHG
jgi:uncharacterized membrane protein (UPF0136 family)